MRHQLESYDSDFLEDGVFAICSCGWKSLNASNLAAANKLHETHVAASRAPTEGTAEGKQEMTIKRWQTQQIQSGDEKQVAFGDNCFIIVTHADHLAEVERVVGEKDRRIKELEQALITMVSPVKHRDGCLFRADRRMPCQCGFSDRVNQAVRGARVILAATEEPHG